MVFYLIAIVTEFKDLANLHVPKPEPQENVLGTENGYASDKIKDFKVKTL